MKRILILLLAIWACDSPPPDIPPEKIEEILGSELPPNKNRQDFLDEINEMTAKIQQLQTAFIREHGFYFQGIAFPDSAGDIDKARIPFSKIEKPTDQTENWEDFGLPDMNVRGQWWIDVYNGSGGQGYVIITRTKFSDGKIYRRMLNVGPEGWRNSNGWFAESPDRK